MATSVSEPPSRLASIAAQQDESSVRSLEWSFSQSSSLLGLTCKTEQQNRTRLAPLSGLSVVLMWDLGTVSKRAPSLAQRLWYYKKPLGNLWWQPGRRTIRLGSWDWQLLCGSMYIYCLWYLTFNICAISFFHAPVRDGVILHV